MSKKYPVADELKQSIETKIEELMQLVASIYPDTIFPPIAVTYKYCGHMAGWAQPLQYKINFHPVLLNLHPQYFLDIIVGHEVAHIVTHHLHGYYVEPHGEEWGRVMTLFGLPMDLHHNLDVTSILRNVTKYEYRCNCEGELSVHMLGSRLNKSIRVDNKAMICSRCNSILNPIEDHKDSNTQIPTHLQHETKVVKAKWILNNLKSEDRSSAIRLLMEGAGLSKAGASTYYHNLKSVVD